MVDKKIELEGELGVPAWYKEGLLAVSGGFRIMDSQCLELDSIISQTINDTLSHPEQYGHIFNIQHESVKFLQNNIELDVLTLEGTLLGIEFVKTEGQKPAEGRSTYLQILSGNCYIIIQKTSFDNESFSFDVSDVKIVKLSEGENIFIPANMGYTIINAQLKDLVVLKMRSLREIRVFDNHKGAAYYIIHKNSRPAFVCNPYFGQLPQREDTEEDLCSSTTNIRKVDLGILSQEDDIISQRSVSYVLGNKSFKLEEIVK
jgi:oxalate decarboxylase/phosphoglucose isomerase-like protein (cupin superfamily)